MFPQFVGPTELLDIRLVALAGIIGLLAAWTTSRMVSRASNIDRQWRQLWLIATGIVSGCSFWATSFILLLAAKLWASQAISPAVAGGALTIAIAGSAFAHHLQCNRNLGSILQGAVIGITAITTHILSLATLAADKPVMWNTDLLGFGLVIGIVLPAAGMRLISSEHNIQRDLLGSSVLAFGVLTMQVFALFAHEMPILDTDFADGDRTAKWLVAIGVGVSTTLVIVTAIVALFFDQHLATRKIHEANRLRGLADAAFEGIVILDAGLIIDANSSFVDLFGTPREQLPGVNLFDYFPPEHAASIHDMMAKHGSISIETSLNDVEADPIPIEVLCRPFDYGGRKVWVAAIRDIRSRREAEARIRHLAHHDVLTGLPNRALFRERFEQAATRASRHQERVALLAIDLDRFKEVNDLYGHGIGDQLLKQVANLLCETSREYDTVARLGGDEFALLQVSASQPAEAAALAERLIAVLAQPFVINDIEVDIGTSIGIAIFPDDGILPEELLNKADMALYRAKTEGRGGYRLYEVSMDVKLQARRALERQLSQAISGGKLMVHYQPQACTQSGEIVGFEALVRWPHPEQGMIPPTVFIPIAEESGLIRPLGEWVLRTACAEAVLWPSHLRLGVNLSPAQFTRDDLPEMITMILSETNLEPHRLELEITEGVLISDVEKAIGILQKLKSIGVQVAMDDFGTGYSSLSYLQRFPFDRIKVDRSFVANLKDKPESASIIKAIVGLSRSLDMPVIAEGVENTSELDLLKLEKCDEIQGFLIGRPMDPDEIPRFLSTAISRVKSDASNEPVVVD